MSTLKTVNPLSVLLVDDHFFVRIGLADSLQDEASIRVVGQAVTGHDAIKQFVELQPDVMLLDLMLPDLRGDEVLNRLSKMGHSFRCVVLSANDREEDIHRCVLAGATSYLCKSIERSELILAIEKVADGGEYFPDDILAKIKSRSNRPSLTPREMETLEHLAAGLSNKRIAAEMGISEATVKLHITHVFEKLGVMDRTQAVTIAIEHGLVHLD